MSKNTDPITLEVDPTTANLLTRLADEWGVSEEEVIRQAVQQASSGYRAGVAENRLEVFKELQRSLGLNAASAADWQAGVRNGRR